MSTVLWVALIGWLIALAIFCGFIVLLRYIEHRERMALISRGIDPASSLHVALIKMLGKSPALVGWCGRQQRIEKRCWILLRNGIKEVELNLG